MNWVSAVTANYDRVFRKATAFSGTKLNIYPWPKSSFVTRVAFSGSYTLNTGPLVGSTIGALANTYFDPVRINVLGNNNGDYNSIEGVYVMNPANLDCLSIDFGQRIGPVDVYVEGHRAATRYLNLNDTQRASTAKFTRICIGSSTAITSFVKNTNFPAWRANSLSSSSTVPTDAATALASPGVTAFTMTGTTHTYILSNAKFSGFQINIGSEDYTRILPYSLQYWNGSAWASIGGTIASTVSTYDNTNLVFHQSGIVMFTQPSDWATTKVSGDPQTTLIANLDTSLVGSTNFSMSDSLYAIRIVPPASNTESVPVISITLFD